MVQRRQNWHARTAWSVTGIPQRRYSSVVSWLRRAASCGAADVEQSSQVRKEAWRAVCVATAVSRVYACCRVAGIPRRTSLHGSPKLFTEQAWMKWRQSHQGDNCDWAGLAELRQAVDRLRMAEAQPTNPADKKHLLLKTGEVKWCWRCGARVEGDSAPRLLLKTACSGALRAKEYERHPACSAKGQHPKSSVFVGLPSPTSDEEWDQWHQDHVNLFFSVSASCPVLEPSTCHHAHTPRLVSKKTTKNKKRTSKQANKQTSKQANKQTSKQANRQTGKQANRQTSKQANKQTSKQANRQTEAKKTNKQKQIKIKIKAHTKTKTHKQSNNQTQVRRLKGGVRP